MPPSIGVMALKTLPNKHQLAFEMHRLGRFKLSKVAGHLGLSLDQLHETLTACYLTLAGAYHLKLNSHFPEALRLLWHSLEAPNAENVSALQTWRLKSLVHEHAFQYACLLWELTAAFPNHLLPAKASLKPWLYGLIAASFMALVAFLAPHVMAPKGSPQIQHLVLENASFVKTAPYTRYQFAQRTEPRVLKLQRGIVFVDTFSTYLSHMRIETPDAWIKANGAQVEVLNHPSELSVSVLAGHVEMHVPHQSETIVLIAGQKLTYRRAQQAIEIRTYPIEQMAMWLEGLIWADNEPLLHLIERLDRYLPGKTFIYDPSLVHTSISGLFRSQQPMQSMRIVLEPHSAYVTEYGPWLRVIKRR